MKQFKVTFEIYTGQNHKDVRSIMVEAGNKSAAYKRGLMEMSKLTEYADNYKSIINVEEVK